MKYFLAILIILLVATGCRNELIHYFESKNAHSIEDKEIKNDVMSIKCYDAFKAAKNERIIILVDFNMKKKYKIDSLDLKVRFDNNEYLYLTNFTYIGGPRLTQSGEMINIQEILSGNNNPKNHAPLYTQYSARDKIMTRYVCHFNGPKSYHPDSLTLEINATLSNKTDTIKYDRELTLYPNTVVFYD